MYASLYIITDRAGGVELPDVGTGRKMTIPVQENPEQYSFGLETEIGNKDGKYIYRSEA
jgi:hypothetical protein